MLAVSARDNERGRVVEWVLKTNLTLLLALALIVLATKVLLHVQPEAVLLERPVHKPT